MTFKERRYECQQCGADVRGLYWNYEQPDPCECGGTWAETGTLLSVERNRGVIDDTIIGGRVCETLGHEPFYYESKSALRKEAARRGLVNVVRHDDAYYAKQRKMHDEKLRDTGTPY